MNTWKTRSGSIGWEPRDLFHSWIMTTFASLKLKKNIRTATTNCPIRTSRLTCSTRSTPRLDITYQHKGVYLRNDIRSIIRAFSLYKWNSPYPKEFYICFLLYSNNEIHEYPKKCGICHKKEFVRPFCSIKPLASGRQ